ncbi:uncharacterized protein RJT20DRAFT_36865 [Scheffersomyces xylosifermentans]|uniref:uncharacterized protein n=1 Tax=Scheffersomyces xylosifermentans TaxID=1304137 RepID=UPI00315D4BCD
MTTEAGLFDLFSEPEKRSTLQHNSQQLESNKENEIASDHFVSPIKRKPIIQQYKSSSTGRSTPVVNSWNDDLDHELSKLLQEKLNTEDNELTPIDHTIRDLREVYETASTNNDVHAIISKLQKLRSLCTISSIPIPGIKLDSSDPMEVNYFKLLLAYNKLVRALTEKNHQLNLVNFKQSTLLSTIIFSLESGAVQSSLPRNDDDITFDSSEGF